MVDAVPDNPTDGDARSLNGGAGDQVILESLYTELRQLAKHRLDREAAGHAHEPTSIVHEAYLKLLGKNGHEPQWANHGHYFAAAAECMRQILIDRARKRKAIKHGGGRVRVHLTSMIGEEQPRDELDIEKLDSALERLANIDQRLTDIVKLRFFAGLTIPQTAQAINVSPRTVERDWLRAQAWLISELTPAPAPGNSEAGSRTKDHNK